MWVNEEGFLLGLKINPLATALAGQAIVGDVVLWDSPEVASEYVDQFLGVHTYAGHEKREQDGSVLVRMTLDDEEGNPGDMVQVTVVRRGRALIGGSLDLGGR